MRGTFIWMSMTLVMVGASGCTKSATKKATNSTTANYTSEMLLNALRNASLKTNLQLPEAADVDALVNAADPFSTYSNLVKGYVNNESFRASMLDYYRTIFGMTDTPDSNNDDMDDDPARLAAGIILNDSDYCEIVTANYKIDGNGAKVAGQDGGDLDKLAGFMTLGSWLQFWKGNNFGFNYVREAARVTECYEYPDPDALGAWTEAQIADKYHSRDGVACFGCHKTINVRRSVWFKFSVDNNNNNAVTYNATLAKGNDLYGHESQLYEGNPVDEPKAGGTYKLIRDLSGSPQEMGKQICELPRFCRCGARRFLAFALGYFNGLAGSGLQKVPYDFDASTQFGDQDLLERWTGEFCSTYGRKVRPFLVAFFQSEDYIQRINNGSSK